MRACVRGHHSHSHWNGNKNRQLISDIESDAREWRNNSVDRILPLSSHSLVCIYARIRIFKQETWKSVCFSYHQTVNQSQTLIYDKHEQPANGRIWSFDGQISNACEVPEPNFSIWYDDWSITIDSVFVYRHRASSRHKSAHQQFRCFDCFSRYRNFGIVRIDSCWMLLGVCVGQCAWLWCKCVQSHRCRATKIAVDQGVKWLASLLRLRR